MDSVPIMNMDVLWPELAEQLHAFEVVVTVPRQDGGEPLVPRALPSEVLGCWSADQVVASVRVVASRPLGAVAATEALAPEMAKASGAVLTGKTCRHSRCRSTLSLSRRDDRATTSAPSRLVLVLG
jgi:hypothetical protein